MNHDTTLHDRLVEHNARQPGFVDLSIPTRTLDRVGIIGAGLMGRSMANICVDAGKAVRLLDADKETAAAAVAQIATAQLTDCAGSIQIATEYSQLSDCDLVIESVVETIAVKQIVLEQVAAHIGPDAIIASNTSAIPIGQLAAFVNVPENFCGIHFCHPELMSLVEIIGGQQTSSQTIAEAVAFARSLKKLPVAVRDTAGFVVNRLLSAMIDQSIRILTSGVRVETIDHAMREFGFQGGPFEIMDTIGTDTCMYAGRTMWDAGVECVSPSPVLPKLVKRKRLGRKSGSGFYRYDEQGGKAVSDDSLWPLIEPYLDKPLAEILDGPGPSAKQLSEIQRKILAAIVREAFQLQAEGIARDVRDIDLCIIHGFAFPMQVGGILRWADSVGIESVVETLNEIARQEPRLAPPELLIEMAEKGKQFYTEG